MSDVTLKIDNDLNLKIVQQNVVLKFYNVISIANAFDYDAYYNSLPPYKSDEVAISDGLSVGDKYRTTDDHVSLPGGVIKTIMAI
jgi:hypothetical protein